MWGKTIASTYIHKYIHTVTHTHTRTHTYTRRSSLGDRRLTERFLSLPPGRGTVYRQQSLLRQPCVHSVEPWKLIYSPHSGERRGRKGRGGKGGVEGRERGKEGEGGGGEGKERGPSWLVANEAFFLKCASAHKHGYKVINKRPKTILWNQQKSIINPL